MAGSAEKLLKASGVRFLTHWWRPFPTFADLLDRHGTFRVVKTLAVDVPDRLVLVALRYEDDLDYSKLAQVLRVDRDPITLAAAGLIKESLGAEPSFETILTDADVDVDKFVDQRVLTLTKVIVSSGRNDRLYELAPADLVSVSGATVADLAADQSDQRPPSTRLQMPF